MTDSKLPSLVTPSIAINTDCDGYVVYRIPTTKRVIFLIYDFIYRKQSRLLVPMVMLEGNVFEKLQQHIKTSKEIFAYTFADSMGSRSGTTVVIIGDNNHFGVCVIGGMIISRITDVSALC